MTRVGSFHLQLKSQRHPNADSFTSSDIIRLREVDASFKFRKQMAPTTTVAHAMCVHAYTNICYIFFNLKILLNFFSNKLNRESCIY